MRYLRFFMTPLSIMSIAMFVSGGLYAADFALSDTLKKTKPAATITDTRSNKPSNQITIKVVPFKPVTTSTVRTSTTKNNPSTKALLQDDDKTLSNVKIFPNPVSDELNLTYDVGRESNVTIKIMDVLGNEITTLFSKRVSSGEQNSTFYIGSKLTSGFYFIRLIVDGESIVKRISVL